MQILSEHQTRLDAAYHLEIPDHVPVFLHINSPWLVSHFGITYREYFNKPKVALRCQLLARKRFGDRTGVYPGNFPLEALVADAWGGPYRIYNDIPMQQTGPVIKSIEEVEELEVPDPTEGELLSKRYDFVKLYREIIRDRVPICIPEEILGGLDVASILRAPKVNYQILLDIIKAPELAHKFAKKCQEWEIERIEHQRDVLGVEADSVWVATSTFQLMSREHAKEFVFPYVQELLDKFRWEHVFWYARPIMHFDPSRHIEDIVEWPIFSRSRLTFEVGYNTDLAKVKEKFGDKICFVGNVNPKTLAFGTPEGVESASRECIGKAAYVGGYVLGAGGEVWEGTPAENLDAMIRTAEKYGKYRINLIS